MNYLLGALLLCEAVLAIMFSILVGAASEYADKKSAKRFAYCAVLAALGFVGIYFVGNLMWVIFIVDLALIYLTYRAAINS